MRIMITGACGYVGSCLAEALARAGYDLVLVDICWFGNHLDETFKVRCKDFRELSDRDFDGVEVVIHLANIANDPSVDLDQTLAWELNCLGTKTLVEQCIRNNVRRFIYASSGSVYGLSEAEKVVESETLTPISTYNKTKMIAEIILEAYSVKGLIDLVVIRPATVCGISKRMRFDVVVNLLVLQAFQNQRLVVKGGSQQRPHIHIDDMVRVYEHFILNSRLIGTFNAGFENISVLDLAQEIATVTGSTIEIEDSNDPRSYRLNSDRLLATGFAPAKTYKNAVSEIFNALDIGKIKDDDRWYSINFMKKLITT